VNLQDLSRQTAAYVDKILKGAKPAELPVEQATKFELVINLAAAKALGLTFSRDFQLLSDAVVE
jgi:putative ABC transport system substrate-binding protein